MNKILGFVALWIFLCLVTILVAMSINLILIGLRWVVHTFTMWQTIIGACVIGSFFLALCTDLKDEDELHDEIHEVHSFPYHNYMEDERWQ